MAQSDITDVWREKAERFIRFYIDSEAKSPPDALNQVYAKTAFAGMSVRGVLNHAKELLKEYENG